MLKKFHMSREEDIKYEHHSLPYGDKVTHKNEIMMKKLGKRASKA
jgi:hypothetical protein